MKRLNLFFTILILFSSSCQDKYTLQDNQRDINEFNEIWQSNGKNGNRLENAKLMTDDGILVRGGKVYSGPEQIRDFLAKQEENTSFIHQEYETVKEWSSSDFYMSLGIRSITYIDTETGDTISTKVPAVNIFERQPDGSLKLSCSMKDSSGN